MKGFILFMFFIKLASSQNLVPYWDPLDSGTERHLRGISVVSDQVAWSSGFLATVLRTVDGGQTWEKVSYPGGMTDNDFRDIEAFDENTAVVMGISVPAMFYKTIDGGQSWTRGYFSTESGTFYDAMDFWDDMNGIAFGDAINGSLTILKTTDGGGTWIEAPFNERPAVDQTGFAASGTCLRTEGENKVYIVLGNTNSTVVYSEDRGVTWSTSLAPVQHGDQNKGLFSIDFKNELEGITVGGDLRGDNATSEENAAYSLDGGQTWIGMDPDKNPGGYRTSVVYYDEDLILTCGKESCDYTYSLSDGFLPMDNVDGGGYYSISVSKEGPKAAYASGPGGKLAKLRFR